VVPVPFSVSFSDIRSIAFWKDYGKKIAPLIIQLFQLPRKKYYDLAKEAVGKKDNFLVNSGAIYKDDKGKVFKSVKDFVQYTVNKSESHKDNGLTAIIPFAQRIQAGFFYFWYIKKC
jgi:hypothetical protein